ncbi:hypothetical protein MBLNU230_g7987t1 [Neophaeotheca triangularis]
MGTSGDTRVAKDISTRKQSNMVPEYEVKAMKAYNESIKQYLEDEIESLRSAIEKEQEDAKRALREYQTTEKKRIDAKVLEALEAFQSEKQTLNAELAKVPARIADAVRESQVQMTGKLAEMQKALNQSKQAHTDTIDSFEKAKIAATKEDTKEFHAQLEALRAENVGLAKSNEDRESDNGNLKTKIERLQRKIASGWIKVYVRPPGCRERPFFRRGTTQFRMLEYDVHEFYKNQPSIRSKFDNKRFFLQKHGNPIIIESGSTKTLNEIGLQSDDELTLK